MKTRFHSSILLCFLVSIASQCKAEQRPFPTPYCPSEPPPYVITNEACETGNPQWLKDELAKREYESKNRERLKPVSVVEPVKEPKKDLGGYNSLDRPLETRKVDTRVKPNTPVPLKEFRAAVPPKGVREPAMSPYSDTGEAAEVVPLSRLSARNEDAAAEVVPLTRIAARPEDPLRSADAETVDLTRPISSSRISAIPVADVIEYPRSAPLPSRESRSPRDLTATDTAPRAEVRETVPAIARGEIAETVEVVRAQSRIEKLYNVTDGLSRRKNLEQFGYKAFVGGLRADPNAGIDPEFVVGPGDEVRLKSVDGFVFDKALTVERDGTIFIETVGAISVAGLRVRDLPAALQVALTQKGLKNFKLDVSLGKLHSIRVMVVGVVKTPGLQNLPANSTLMDALMAVGGPTRDRVCGYGAKDLKPGQISQPVRTGELKL